jgi:hypothetical protein
MTAFPAPVTRDSAGVDGQPSRLSDVLRGIVALFRLAGHAVPIQIGEQYLKEFRLGNGPRILLVPEPEDGGAIGDPITMGHACSVTSACDVLVRGALSPTDDLARFDSAYRLRDLFLSGLAVEGTGYVSFEKYGNNSPAGIDAGAGAEVKFRFLFQSDVLTDPGLAAIAGNTTPGTPAPQPPVVGGPAVYGTTSTVTLGNVAPPS